MAQVRWTPQAVADLDAIADFIAVDSPHFAALFVANVLESIDRLMDFPQCGRTVSEIGDPAVRELIMGNYRIIYRLCLEIAEILTVHHGARLLDPRRIQEQ